MEDVTKVLEWIEDNSSLNLSLINFVEDNPVYSAKRIGSSVLVRGISDHPWVYIDSHSEEELKELASHINHEDKFFAAIEDWMLPVIIKDRIPSWRLKTYQYILPEDVRLDKNEYKVLPLSPNDADYIFDNSNYKDVLSSAYIRERIIKGFSAGIKEDGKLVAWVLTHDDGSVGCLHVLKGHRHKGYAYAVATALFEKIRESGKKPFVYVDDSNETVINLIKHLGLKKTNHMNWFELAS